MLGRSLFLVYHTDYYATRAKKRSTPLIRHLLQEGNLRTHRAKTILAVVFHRQPEMTQGTRSSPSTMMECPMGGAQSHVEDGRLCCNIDVVAAKPGLHAARRARLPTLVQQEREGLVSDAVLRVDEVDADGLDRQAFPIGWCLRKHP